VEEAREEEAREEEAKEGEKEARRGFFLKIQI
jgi:hypothetical protein